MGVEDKAKLDEILDAKRARLNELLKQQAIAGFRTDPAVLIEINMLRHEVGIIAPAAAQPEMVEAAEQIGAGGRHVVIEQRFDQLEKRNNERLDRFESRLERLVDRIENALTKRIDDVEENAVGRHLDMEEKRKTATNEWQKLFWLLGAGVLIALVVEVLIIAGIFR
jgi:hypothetical protein